jgi:lipopolysaccharide export system protein LptA
MRGMRWLLLVAIAAILGGVAYRYRAQRTLLASQTTPTPDPLAAELSASSQHWSYRNKDLKTGRVVADLDAESMEQPTDASRVDLKRVTMKIYSKTGPTYDLVKSAAATFNSNDRSLYSQGEVEITLNLPIEGQPARQPTVIKSSGVTFDSNTGRSDTDQPSSFVFEKGDGKATGATYDPTKHQLEMKHDVEIHWNPPGKNAKPMKIEATGLSYHETLSEIWLKPTGKMTRENTVVEGSDVVVRLQDQVIRQITAVNAHGTDDFPNRKLRYAAEELAMEFDDDGVAQKINGNRNASLVSASEGSETTVTGDRVDLAFDNNGHDAVLSHVTVNGNAVVTAKPLPLAGRPLTETHVLRSESFEIKMRADGREIETLTTKTPGKIEFLPNLATQHHRILDGNDFVIQYGEKNRVDTFKAVNVKTQTDPTPEELKRKNRSVSMTTSKDLEARFDPKTGHMATMRQSGDFAYEEGDRRAKAAKATMDSDQNVIVLDSAARIWDATGSTNADRIRLDQRTGDFSAEGNVSSTRLPDKDQKKNSEMLSGDAPLQATARKMDSRNRNRTIRYEGGVNLWQGANRIRADAVDIDRAQDKKTLVADGHVITNLWEEPKDEAKKKTATPSLTEVHAGHMVYTEEGRITHYTGGVQLARPALQVKSQELRAFLAESGADSRVEKAYADGAVEIFSTGKDRTRTGTGEHAEYYTADQKVILRGPWVKMVEKIFAVPQPNTTEGKELTYYANDDRLVVTSDTAKPGQTLINRKKGK